jgi:probable phosphoglycerate mutase
LVLLRHGRTEWNRVGRAQGHADVPLDDVGRAQAAVAAEHLAAFDVAFVWSSDLARARETAEVVAAKGRHEVRYDERLREFDVGARQGLTFAEFEAQYPDEVARFRAGERVDVPGAESHEAVGKRMAEVLWDAVDALDEGQTALLVGHGAALRLGILWFFGTPPELREMIAGLGNCAWAVLEEHHDRGWQIIDYNAQTIPPPLDLADDDL